MFLALCPSANVILKQEKGGIPFSTSFLKRSSVMRQIDFLPLFGPVHQKTGDTPIPTFTVMGTFHLVIRKKKKKTPRLLRSAVLTHMHRWTRDESMFFPISR